ncbi:MAG: sodium:solute symporter [Pseudomonadota bacterium]|nr:sodium:solute symporter [Pseudomonadota bacterium]
MRLALADLATLVVYLALVAAVGLYFSRRNDSTEEYFVGGRAFPGWAIGLSLVGTSISSITFLAYPGDAYKTAWARYVPNLALPIGAFVAAYFFIRFFRQGKTTTAYEYLEKRFGPSIRVYAALAFICAQLVRISIILYLLALLVRELTGLDVTLCIVLAGVFVGLYTIVGGFDAVIWTDVIQTLVLLVGGALCLYVVVDLLPGGLDQVFRVAAAHDKLSFSDLKDGQLQPLAWGFGLSEKTVSMLFLMGLISWLTEYTANQNTVQRYCASKSDREARKAMLVCALASLPIWAFYMFLGTALFVFFQQFPAPEAAAMLDGSRKAEGILPYFIMNHLPTGLAGLVIAAALAAAMSSLDSSINAISTVGIVDIYRRHLRPGRSDGHYLRRAWVIAAITSGLMIMGAVVLSRAHTTTLQDASVILTSLLGGGLLGMYLLGFCTRHGDARAVWAGIVATALFTLWTILAHRGWLPAGLTLPFDLYYTGLVGNILMFAVGFAVSSLWGYRRRELAGLTFFSPPPPAS